MMIEGKTRVDFELYATEIKSLLSADKKLIQAAGEPVLEVEPDGTSVLKVLYAMETLEGYIPEKVRGVG